MALTSFSDGRYRNFRWIYSLRFVLSLMLILSVVLSAKPSAVVCDRSIDIGRVRVGYDIQYATFVIENNGWIPLSVTPSSWSNLSEFENLQSFCVLRGRSKEIRVAFQLREFTGNKVWKKVFVLQTNDPIHRKIVLEVSGMFDQ